MVDAGFAGKMEMKSRKERRKEARQAKRQKGLHQWAIKQAGRMRRGENLLAGKGSSPGKDGQRSEARRKQGLKRGRRMEHKGKAKKARTKFEAYLEMERKMTGEESLEMERQLAKKLKVKNGKLKDVGDGFDELLEGLETTMSHSDSGESAEDEEMIVHSPRKRKDTKNVRTGLSKRKKVTELELEQMEKSDEDESVQHSEEEVEEDLSMELSDHGQEDDQTEPELSLAHLPEDEKEEDASHDDKTVEMSKSSAVMAKYVPPHLRNSEGGRSEEMIRLQRRVRGLLNKLGEANVESIVSEFSSMFQVHGRRVIGEFVTEEILLACCGGPRGNDQYAAVFAAFIAGISAVVGIDFGAKFMASFSVAYEEQYRKGESLGLRNLTLLFSHLFLFQLLPSDLVYDLLGVLCKRFEELDVATILCILQSCGVQLRGEDPAAMKEFILAAQNRTADLNAVCSEKKTTMGKRVSFMLDTIFEIKNNKRRTKDEPTGQTRLKKWLHKLGVEDVQLRGVTWSKLLDPDKKGQWWLAGGHGEEHDRADMKADVAGAMDAGAVEAEKMLQLAASQRMNTDARRAVFCIVMSSEDYLDAFEKVLRLKLPGKQDREIPRVIVECCLQEKIFNKYYALLASKMCHHEKNHKFSLQYCLWDHFKQLESMDIRRSANLARLLAELIGSLALSMTVLKTVDFSDARMMTTRVVLHFRIFFQTFLTEFSEEVIRTAFSRIAAPPELASLRDGIKFFLHQHVRRLESGQSTVPSVLAIKCKLAKKALSNKVGVTL